MPGFDKVASLAPRVASARPESTERSGTYRSTLPPQTLSSRFWGLDLSSKLPRVLSRDGIEAVRGELGRVREFLVQAFPTFTEEELGVVPDPRMVEAKRRYLHTASDLIELRHDGRTVGVMVGAPEDWSSFYVRIFAILPEYQRPGLTRRFTRECLFEPLAEHGVERVVAETWPTNIAMSHCFTELRFHVTGHQLSERWGALVRYTKFLDPAREAAFQRRFAADLPKRRNPGRSTR
jgi:ribosomal protein S18 acetylase RimI-like enzyme